MQFYSFVFVLLLSLLLTHYQKENGDRIRQKKKGKTNEKRKLYKLIVHSRFFLAVCYLVEMNGMKQSHVTDVLQWNRLITTLVLTKFWFERTQNFLRLKSHPFPC
jgi:hypothetical protein